jgi:hypothetical protein
VPRPPDATLREGSSGLDLVVPVDTDDVGGARIEIVRYAADTIISAPAARVWSVITDAAAYPSWDSGVTKVEGRIADGQKITVHAAVAKGRAFPVKVAFDPPGRTMTWTGGMPLGLFRGVRTFTVTEEGGATRLSVVEEFTGPLLPLMRRSMPDLQPSFDQYVAGVRARAES